MLTLRKKIKIKFETDLIKNRRSCHFYDCLFVARWVSPVLPLSFLASLQLMIIFTVELFVGLHKISEWNMWNMSYIFKLEPANIWQF